MIRHCAPQPQTPRRQHAAAKASVTNCKSTALGSLVLEHLLQFGAATLMQ